jgi:hypothetical protein
MRSTGGDSFEIVIPLFVLDSPYQARQVH